ncbi:MAG: penicillin-binding transpeptidase domain-containing protein [Oscillospiraceae bacterium]
MDKLVKPSRLAIIIILLIIMSVTLFISLYRLQIIDGAAYYEQSKNSISSTSVVEAVRGNIFDRYGRSMTSNRTCNNLVINTDELFEQSDPNAIILQLTQSVLDSGNSYTDTLPITKQAPFEFIPKMTDIQRTALNGYFEANDLPVSTSAVELMAFFRKKFDIDNNYSSDQMRTIAGVRYEIKIRHIDTIHTSDYIFAEDVSIDLITRLMENDVPGFEVRSSFIREYNTGYGAHILGYVGMMNAEEYKELKGEGYPLNAVIGKDGMEKAFEKYLHGTDGRAVVTSTRGGTIIGTKYLQEPLPGNNVYSTIDLGIQEKAELSLSSYMTETNAKREIDNAKYKALGETDEIKELITGGAVAAVNVKTGEPLCLASAPSFDLNTFLEDFSKLNEDKNTPMVNRALMGTYAPGSTFKPVTAIAALNEGVAEVNTTVYDKGKYEKYKDSGYSPECWLYPHGSHGDVNVTGALKVSCNYYFYTIGDLLGIDKMAEYALRFGLGKHTGIELPEEIGIMANQKYKKEVIEEKWYQGDTLSAAIGQSYSLFTPLQIANYIAAVANNGTRYEASILKSVRSYDSAKSIYVRQPKVAETVSADQKYYDAVKLGMYQVANDIDGTAFKVFGNYPVKVAAKTGTAERGKTETNNGVFVCYAPYDDPEIAVAVVVEKGGSGSALAGIAKDVLDYYFAFKNSSAVPETENSLLK